MIEDTSSRFEWYDETSEPDVPEELTGYLKWQMNKPLTLSSFPSNLFGLQIGQIVQGPGGDVGVVQSIGSHGQATIQIRSDARQFGKSMQDVGNQLHSLVQTINSFASVAKDVLSDHQSPEETVQEKALRLKQQPHSMAQDPSAFHFDVRGRRRRR